MTHLSTLRAAAVLLAAVAGGACTELASDLPDGGEIPGAVEVSRQVPVVHLGVDAAEFADMMTRYEEDVKIDARACVYRDGAPVVCDGRARVQVKGNRSSRHPLKSLGIKFDDPLDNRDGAVLAVPYVSPRHSLDALKAVRVRNGGNEFLASFLKDLGFARMLARAELDVEVLYGEPAATYVNDEFYGLVNLRSESNGHGLSRLLGIDRDAMSLAEVVPPGVFDVKEGDPARFGRLADAVAVGDLAYLRDEIDLASFTDYVIAGATFAVWDWPWNNVRVYADGDGPLRFVSFDFDQAAEIHPDKGLLYHVRAGDANVITDLFAVLYADPAFRAAFWRRYDEIAAAGGLRPERLRAELESLAATFDPLIAYQTVRHGYPVSRAAWYVDLERVVEGYEARYAGLLAYDGREEDGVE